MFYSDVILTKRGPLANVWLAAMMERRLSKTQFLKTSVEKSVAAIVGQDATAIPMALRLSGQLLIGVVRIYSRKAKYLLDDCNEALLKIKMAFRSGAVDMTTAESLTAPRSAITLPTTRSDFDMMLPDPLMFNWEFQGAGAAGIPGSGSSARRRAEKTGMGAAHTARASDITLPRLLMQQDGGNYDAGFDLTQGGINSFDFDDAEGGGLDLGLDIEERRDATGRLVDANGDPLDEEREVDDSLSIGLGRRAESDAGRSLGSLLGVGAGGADLTFGENEMPDMGGDDGFDFGIGASRAVTPAGQAVDDSLIDLTPRTANKIREAAARREAEAEKARTTQKRLVIDSVTEMDQRASALVKADQNQYLSRSKSYLQLLAIQANPLDHFFGAPGGMAPQLTELFEFDAAALRRSRGQDDDAGPLSKRQRRSGSRDNEDWGSEVGRRAPGGEGSISGFPLGGGDLSYGDEGAFDLAGDDGMPDLDAPALDLDDIDAGLRRSSRVLRKGEEVEGALPALARLGTPELLSWDAGESLDPSNHLAVFDARPADAEGEEGASQEVVDASRREEAATTAQATAQGWSKNTVRALKIVKSQLTGLDANEDEEAAATTAPSDAKISFEATAARASRRAAAGFFFELLVLGTKDCVELKQKKPYGDIEIAAREKLWELTGSSGVASA